MIPACRTMPTSPAIAMPPMPIGRPKSLNSCSGDTLAASGITDPTNGTTRNHTRHEPAVMIVAYFRPLL